MIPQLCIVLLCCISELNDHLCILPVLQPAGKLPIYHSERALPPTPHHYYSNESTTTADHKHRANNASDDGRQ